METNLLFLLHPPRDTWDLLVTKLALEEVDKLRKRTILAGTIILLVFVTVSCVLSEVSWSNKMKQADSVRQYVGLSSIIVGNLNPSARSPGLEFLCTSLYDAPGGYCYYFAPGVPDMDLAINLNITKVGTK